MLCSDWGGLGGEGLPKGTIAEFWSGLSSLWVFLMGTCLTTLSKSAWFQSGGAIGPAVDWKANS
eukprot:9504004-Pyramimonas_sp.AAC.1